jgi:hypothetical protein
VRGPLVSLLNSVWCGLRSQAKASEASEVACRLCGLPTVPQPWRPSMVGASSAGAHTQPSKSTLSPPPPTPRTHTHIYRHACALSLRPWLLSEPELRVVWSPTHILRLVPVQCKACYNRQMGELAALDSRTAEGVGPGGRGGPCDPQQPHAMGVAALDKWLAAVSVGGPLHPPVPHVAADWLPKLAGHVARVPPCPPSSHLYGLSMCSTRWCAHCVVAGEVGAARDHCRRASVGFP